MEPTKDVLPADFDGIFRFTNPTNEEFKAKWNGKTYSFPPMSTSPMIIHDATPTEIQNIRKKFAKELAQREFFKSEEYNKLTSIEKANNGPALNSIMGANSYSEKDLTSYIQKCLEPLPVTRATVEEAPKENIEELLHRDEEGELRTRVVDKKVSLKQKALQA